MQNRSAVGERQSVDLYKCHQDLVYDAADGWWVTWRVGDLQGSRSVISSILAGGEIPLIRILLLFTTVSIERKNI